MSLDEINAYPNIEDVPIDLIDKFVVNNLTNNINVNTFIDIKTERAGRGYNVTYTFKDRKIGNTYIGNTGKNRYSICVVSNIQSLRSVMYKDAKKIVEENNWKITGADIRSADNGYAYMVVGAKFNDKPIWTVLVTMDPQEFTIKSGVILKLEDFSHIVYYDTVEDATEHAYKMYNKVKDDPMFDMPGYGIQKVQTDIELADYSFEELATSADNAVKVIVSPTATHKTIRHHRKHYVSYRDDTEYNVISVTGEPIDVSLTD